MRPPRVEELPLGVSALESTADAVLVIGDRAMRVPHEPFLEVVDLAEAWHELTALPFRVRLLGGARRVLNWANCRRRLSKAGHMGLAEAAVARPDPRATAGTRCRHVLRLLDASSVL